MYFLTKLLHSTPDCPCINSSHIFRLNMLEMCRHHVTVNKVNKMYIYIKCCIPSHIWLYNVLVGGALLIISNNNKICKRFYVI